MIPIESEEPLRDMDDETYEIQEAARLEAERLDNYRAIFEKTHRPPEPPNYPVEPPRVQFSNYEVFKPEEHTFFGMKGVEAVVNWVATICGIIFSAVRTTAIFGQLERELLIGYNFDPIMRNGLSVLAAVSLVGVIEGVLAGFGYRKGKKSGRADPSFIPAILAGSISALAGLIPSFDLVKESAFKDGVTNFTSWLLVFLSGPGIAYLIFMVTENIGYLHNEWKNEVVAIKDGIDKRNKDAKKEWDDEYNTAHQIWETTCHNLQLDYDQKYAAYQNALEEDYRKRGRPLLYKEESFTVKRRSSNNNNHHVPEIEQDEVNPDVKNRVIDFLNSKDPPIPPDAVGVKPGCVISPKEIAEALGIRNRHGEIDSNAVRGVIRRLKTVQ